MKVFYPKKQIFVDLPEKVTTKAVVDSAVTNAKVAVSSLDAVNLQTKVDGNWNDPVTRVVAVYEIPFEEIKPKTNKELYAELNRILGLATKALTEAEKFAEKHKLAFSFGGPGGPEVSYYPHSDKIRSEHSEDMEDNYMVTETLEEGETVEPLKEHKSEVHYSYDYDEPFKGGWWIPSQFC